MSSVPIQHDELLPEDELLRSQIYTTQRRLYDLQQALERIDTEAEGLGEQRERFELLEQACGTLEKLDELGGAHLFWGSDEHSKANEYIRLARERVGSLREKLQEIEERRHAVVDQINDGQDVLDILEADLFELELQEEERKQEWVIERELVISERPALMPWARGEDSQRFRKILAVSALYALLFGLVVPQINLPLPDLAILPEVPDRLARLIEEQALPPPPPIVEPEPVPEEVEPEPIVVEELPEEVPEVPQETAPTVAEEPAPQERVRSAGILAFRENFSSLAADREASQLGAQARINDAGESAVGRTERAMVTSQGPGSSGGINLSSLSRDVGQGGAGPGLDGVEVGRVASSIGGGGTGDRPLAGGGATAGRTDEEIQIVFDRYKAALYRLYNRELRNDPTLQGQVVLRLTIEADGSVSFCEVSASDMGAPTLEQQVVDRVLTFDFGAKEGIAAITILYPIDFLPAA